MVEGVDVLGNGFRVDMDQDVHAADLGHVLTEQIHFLKLPAGIDMHQREWRG